MICLGTELKFNVHVKQIGDIHMSDYDFECDFFVFERRKVNIRKSDMKKVDDDNYLAMIATEQAVKMGKGRICMELTAYIPDEDFPDGMRTEKTRVCTDIVIA